MTQQSSTKPQTLPLEALALRPSQVIKRYSLPRDRLYGAIARRELRALNVGTPEHPAFLLRVSDVEAWLETLTYGGKK
ncbi:hypothetical protein [Deinococcus enclensis]|uniref:DNA-binding protein n=1 Tax=Deinococcus enclensis TaxID=1049582 RepID=A0ABT9MCX4_9DEIO|nr:hypothetical protein [Deinococcus enclensis]MDP9764461.1 hypothetical protein [Deinococcus enclensis]